MHIAVCIKQVPNPEAAFSQLKVDEQAKKVVPAPGMPLVMSPFDEQAVEAALRVREQTGGARITALTIGPESARNALKHALAMGADDAVLVNDPALEDAGPEATAMALSRAISSLGAVDLVLTGRQSADSDAGIVGCGIAELLQLPVVTFARKIEVGGSNVRVERVLTDGFETLEGSLPAVITVSNELGEARKPNLRETMRAARKPIAVKSAADIGLEAGVIETARGRRSVEKLFVPVKDRHCDFIEGADACAQALALVERLKEARLV